MADEKIPPQRTLPTPPARPAREPEKETEAKADRVKDEYEKKLTELEKRLREEREKLLVTQLRRQEEEAASAKVEVGLKELQDRLRRDHREQEAVENKLKLEKRAQELEARLAQERETWVATLKNQLATRESGEKEVETHFAMRLQEMERRWLEEKANWQRNGVAKDEEIRNLRTLAEKLKGADTELAKVSSEKRTMEGRVENKIYEERIAELSKERSEALLRLQNAAEHEKEAVQLKAELQMARQSAAMVQERLERDLAAVRASAREREERLASDCERLHGELSTAKARFDLEKESELRRAKAEHDAELSRQKDAAERLQGELQRLRAIAGALERQSASSHVQLEELKRASAEWERMQERYKAEFVVLQRKWVEREKEVRAEAHAQSMQMLESEKTRLRIQAQDELNQRAAKIADQLRQENESDQRRAETKLRAELEIELQTRRHELQVEADAARTQIEAELGRAKREASQKDAAWSERLSAKDSEALAARARADELASRLSRAEEARQALERRALDLEAAGARLEREKTEFERLATAQAAQIHSTQEALEAARLRHSRPPAEAPAPRDAR